MLTMKVYALAAIILLAVACGSDDEAPGSVTPAPDTSIPAPNTPTPIAGHRVGDTAPINYFADERDALTLTFASATDSNIAVRGPYIDGTYTFTALPDRKFFVLTFRFRNVGIRPVYTLSLGGTLTTDRGFEFPVWTPTLGVLSEEYSPRLATEEEMQTVAQDGAAGVELFPEAESEVGALIFEIPNGQQAVSISVSWVDQPLLLK